MILTPEQEALVEASAEAMYAAHVARNKPWAITSLFEKEKWRASARAIIPLIYTAGRRAGREEAAVVADEMAEGARVLHNAAAADRDNDGISIHGEAWRVSKHTAFAIRNLSEQESGR